MELRTSNHELLRFGRINRKADVERRAFAFFTVVESPKRLVGHDLLLRQFAAGARLAAMDAEMDFLPDPVIEAYKRDIDRTLLRRNLKLSVEERFLQLQELQRLAEELCRAGRQASR